MNLLIVDDEALARSRLRRLLAQMPEAGLARIDDAADARQARELLDRGDYQVVLVDIQMPGDGGLQLAAQLQQARPHAAAPPALVFVTAHSEHALQAFEHGAVDYLTKPVRPDRLQQALQRARALLGSAPAPEPEAPALLIPERGSLVRIALDDIRYCRADTKYTEVRTATRSYWIDTSLGELEQRHAPRLMRVHRSILVQRGAIAGLERCGTASGSPGTPGDAQLEGSDWGVRLHGAPELLPVSRRQLPIVRAWLKRSG